MNAQALPEPPVGAGTTLPSVPAAGPYWRVWHPTTKTVAANAGRHFGPLNRFDPHPAGPPKAHDDIFVLYGSLAFEVSALEVFNRGADLIEICPNWRGSLVTSPAGAQLFDLVTAATAMAVGATPRLGDTNLDGVGYATTQAWGRFFYAGGNVHGLRYFSCRAADRAGIATVVWRAGGVGEVADQHLLIDDALWPYLVHTLESAGVGVSRVPNCPKC